MKEGLDLVRSKVQALTAKVKANSFPTGDGISYLEAKHLLLLNYCQSLVYYTLRKAKGLSVEKHPVVQSLVEIRLFLEKIRPMDKKLEYQTQKLMRDAGHENEQVGVKKGKDSEASGKSEDLLKYRPNPDNLLDKSDQMPAVSVNGGGVYRPPKIAPAMIDEDKMSKQERNALRRQRHTLWQSRQGYMKEMIDDFAGRPEEVKENDGIETKEYRRYQEKWEQREQEEEELFTRAPLTKMEKKQQKHLKKSRNGLLGLTESFYDDLKTLPLDDDTSNQTAGFGGGSSVGKLKKRKVYHMSTSK
uniref:Sas10 C-terminal domain-containing protein n=1 Tax=Turnera subulata TaxID=218843 RepID=A0A516IJK5_9ROSI